MSDEIKQSGNVARVLPLNPTRDAGRRKRPAKQQSEPEPEKRDQQRPDDQSHHVDEYV